jgi:cell division protein FtsL
MKNTSLPALSALWSWGVFVWVILIVMVLVSALAVVWIKHEVRLTSTQLHKTIKQEYALRVEQGRLELEYNHLLSRSRIEQVAKDKLDMMAMTPVQERVLLLPEGAIKP